MKVEREWAFPAKKVVIKGANGESYKTLSDDKFITDNRYEINSTFEDLCDEEKQFVMDDYLHLVRQLDQIQLVMSNQN